MPSELAQRLRDARAAHNISLDEAEQVTKIRRKYLEAMEAGDFALLPDGPPARGFIRNYARYLGLDPEAAIKLFEAEVGVPVLMLRDPAPPPPVRHKQVSQLTQVALPAPRVADEQIASESALAEGVQASAQQTIVRRDGTTGKAIITTITRPLRASGSSFRLKDIRGPFTQYDPNMMSARGPKRPFSAMARPSWVEQYLPYGLGVLALAGVVAFFVLVVVPVARDWIGTILPPQPQATATDAPAFVPQVTIFAPQPTPAPMRTDQPAPTAAESVEQPVAPAQPAPVGSLQLALDARERAWVRVRVDGNVVFEGIPPLGPGIPFSANESIQVETGNAGAFDIILNNVRLGPLGARNETVVKTWNATP